MQQALQRLRVHTNTCGVTKSGSIEKHGQHACMQLFVLPVTCSQILTSIMAAGSAAMHTPHSKLLQSRPTSGLVGIRQQGMAAASTGCCIEKVGLNLLTAVQQTLRHQTHDSGQHRIQVQDDMRYNGSHLFQRGTSGTQGNPHGIQQAASD